MSTRAYSLEIRSGVPEVLVIPRRRWPAVVFALHGEVLTKTLKGTRLRVARLREGEAAIFPPGPKECVTWRRGVDVLQVNVDPSWLGIAGADPAALSHCIRATGPAIQQLGRALHELQGAAASDRPAVDRAIADLVDHLRCHYVLKAEHLPPELVGIAPLADIVADLHREPAGKYSVEELASRSRVTRFHFCRRFRLLTGMSPVEYLHRVRVDRAKELLSEGATKLPEIALDCGFSDQSHFTRVFRRYVGVSPGRYRRAAALVSPIGGAG